MTVGARTEADYGGGVGALNFELFTASVAGLDTSRICRLGIPDHFVEHGERGELLADLGLDAAGIVAACRRRGQWLPAESLHLAEPEEP